MRYVIQSLETGEYLSNIEPRSYAERLNAALVYASVEAAEEDRGSTTDMTVERDYDGSQFQQGLIAQRTAEYRSLHES